MVGFSGCGFRCWVGIVFDRLAVVSLVGVLVLGMFLDLRGLLILCVVV